MLVSSSANDRLSAYTSMHKFHGCRFHNHQNLRISSQKNITLIFKSTTMKNMLLRITRSMELAEPSEWLTSTFSFNLHHNGLLRAVILQRGDHFYYHVNIHAYLLHLNFRVFCIRVKKISLKAKVILKLKIIRVKLSLHKNYFIIVTQSKTSVNNLSLNSVGLNHSNTTSSTLISFHSKSYRRSLIALLNTERYRIRCSDKNVRISFFIIHKPT